MYKSFTNLMLKKLAFTDKIEYYTIWYIASTMSRRKERRLNT